MSDRMDLEAFVAALDPADRRALGARFARRCDDEGAYVIRPDGSHVPLPPILTPTVLSDETLSRVASDSRRITSALVKATRALMTDPELAEFRSRLFGDFGPLEAQALEQTWQSASALATVRVDYLVDTGGRHRALEVNATIPAMQGYSDIVAESFLRVLGQAAGLDEAECARLVDANGRNTDDLLDSLLEHHHRLTGRRDRTLFIAIVARRGDAQIGELRHYERRWTERGHRVRIVAPDDLIRSAAHGGEAIVAPDEVVPDLIYRHIFLRRLVPGSEFAAMCLQPERYRVLNPPASHLEVKAMLALLSTAVEDAALARTFGLSDDELDAIGRAVPWTRVLGPGPTRDPAGDAVSDLVQWTAAHAEHLVIKKSWDYGGRSVFLGREPLDPGRVAGVEAVAGARSWTELVRAAAADRGAWVVQGFVDSAPRPVLRVGPDGPVEASLYADLSGYTNLGVAFAPTGGAVRASTSRIVNILGGGGMSPLLRESVLSDPSWTRVRAGRT